MEGAVRAALENGCEVDTILQTMRSAMEETGERFQKRKIFVPEMLLAAKTMQRGIGVLKSCMGTTENKGRLGKFIIGTVEGDLHDVGKNLVVLMLETEGFEVIDLGVDVSPVRFTEALRENPDCRLIGLSALLTTTLGSMDATVEELKKAGLRDRVKILIGGAPVTEEYAVRIGADAYTTDAAGAAKKALELSLQTEK